MHFSSQGWRRLASAWGRELQVPDLPSPVRTWEESKIYILEPFVKRGETDQGIALLEYYSLMRVAQGFLLGVAIGTPVGFLFGVSPLVTRMFDPLMQIMRPISPLAWLPLGLVLFQKSEPAALFAIAVCCMWPTIINTMMGVRAIPQDYWNVARVLRLSPTPPSQVIAGHAEYFNGYRETRIACGIVAARCSPAQRGRRLPWQETTLDLRPHPVAIITIGIIGFVWIDSWVCRSHSSGKGRRWLHRVSRIARASRHSARPSPAGTRGTARLSPAWSVASSFRSSRDGQRKVDAAEHLAGSPPPTAQRRRRRSDLLVSAATRRSSSE